MTRGLTPRDDIFGDEKLTLGNRTKAPAKDRERSVCQRRATATPQRARHGRARRRITHRAARACVSIAHPPADNRALRPAVASRPRQAAAGGCAQISPARHVLVAGRRAATRERGLAPGADGVPRRLQQQRRIGRRRVASERRPRDRTTSARPGTPPIRPDRAPATAVRRAEPSRAIGGVADGRRIPGDGQPGVSIPGRDRNRPAAAAAAADDDDDDDDDEIQPRRRFSLDASTPATVDARDRGSAFARVRGARGVRRVQAGVEARGEQTRGARRIGGTLAVVVRGKRGEGSRRLGDDVFGRRDAGFAPAVRLFLPGRRRRVRGTSSSGRLRGIRRLADVFAAVFAKSFFAKSFFAKSFFARRRREFEPVLSERLFRILRRLERNASGARNLRDGRVGSAVVVQSTDDDARPRYEETPPVGKPRAERAALTRPAPTRGRARRGPRAGRSSLPRRRRRRDRDPVRRSPKLGRRTRTRT